MTDEENGLTLPQIQEQLAGFNITVERKALYRDLDALRDVGIEVARLKTRPVSYAITNRLFTHDELMLLSDAIQTSKSLTTAEADKLLSQVMRLASVSQAKSLETKVHAPHAANNKYSRPEILKTTSSIRNAISQTRDISFSYVRHNIEGRLQEVESADGVRRTKTPLFLAYDDGRYYMLAYDENSTYNIRVYRVDRMRNVLIGDASDPSHKASASFDLAKFERVALGMFNKPPIRIELLVAENAMSAVIDLFGEDGPDAVEAKDIPELPSELPSELTNGTIAGRSSEADDRPEEPQESRKWARVSVKASPSPVLFGKIAQFAGDVRIEKPADVANDYAAHLKRALDSQNL